MNDGFENGHQANRLAIIREGDPTTHGGVVQESFENFNLYGRRAAGIGHRGYCPQCKRNFVIIAGAQTLNYLGRNVAVEGMQTSCGAALIATQRQATVELRPVRTGQDLQATGAVATVTTDSIAVDEDLECYFVAVHDDGSAANLAYRIDGKGEVPHEGRLDDKGATRAFSVTCGDEPIFWTPSK